MKRIISLLLSFLMLISLASCFMSPLEVGNKKTVITRGTINNEVYVNDCMGIEFVRPATWVYSTDEEIATVIGVGVEMLGDKRFQAALDENYALYDMMVVDKITNTNIIVGYENLKMSLSTNITEEQYIESVRKQFDDVENMTVTFPYRTEKVKLGNTSFTRIVCDTVTNGVRMTQVFYAHKMNGYMGIVVVTMRGDYTVEDIEAMFR